MSGRPLRRLLCGVLWLLPAAVARAQAPFGLPTPEPSPAIRPIVPPVPVLPYPLWMIVAAGAVALLVLALLVWAVVRHLRNRPGPPEPTAREAALAALERLGRGVETAEPYPFSVAVSDVLRHFVAREFLVRATAQTSPEFLAEAAASGRFSAADRELLAAFLERADLIKFARVHATAADSAQLLEQAFRFVKGGGPA